MEVEIVQVWEDYPLFETKLNARIKDKEPYYEIIDIKYSTFYNTANKQWNYSALILFREKEGD